MEKVLKFKTVFEFLLAFTAVVIIFSYLSFLCFLAIEEFNGNLLYGFDSFAAATFCLSLFIAVIALVVFMIYSVIDDCFSNNYIKCIIQNIIFLFGVLSYVSFFLCLLYFSGWILYYIQISNINLWQILLSISASLIVLTLNIGLCGFMVKHIKLCILGFDMFNLENNKIK